jgi:AraC family transcriptional regulator
MRPFVHENVGFELTWVERGSLHFLAGGRALDAAAGSCVLLPPGIENTPTDWHVAHQITLARPLVEEAADALGPAGNVPTAAIVLPAAERLTSLARLLARDADAGITHDNPGLVALVDALSFALVRSDSAPDRGSPDRRPARGHDPAARRGPAAELRIARTSGVGIPLE